MEHREMEALPFRMHRWYFPYRKHRQNHRLCGESSRRDAVSLDNFMTLSELGKGLFTEGSVCFTIQVEITMKINAERNRDLRISASYEVTGWLNKRINSIQQQL